MNEGKRIQHSTGTSNKKLAEKAYSRAMKEIEEDRSGLKECSSWLCTPDLEEARSLISIGKTWISSTGSLG
jgi:hypothetical protein